MADIYSYNANVKYPIEDTDSHPIRMDMLADLSLCIPQGHTPRITALRCGGGIGFLGIEDEDGTPIASCGVVDAISTRVYPLQMDVPGEGWVVFGPAVYSDSPVFPESEIQAVIDSRCIIEVPELAPVFSLRVNGLNIPLEDNLIIEIPEGVLRTEITGNVVTISRNDDELSEFDLADLLDYQADPTGRTSLITSIAGTPPDAYGNIDIVFNTEFLGCRDVWALDMPRSDTGEGVSGELPLDIFGTRKYIEGDPCGPSSSSAEPESDDPFDGPQMLYPFDIQDFEDLFRIPGTLYSVVRPEPSSSSSSQPSSSSSAPELHAAYVRCPEPSSSSSSQPSSSSSSQPSSSSSSSSEPSSSSSSSGGLDVLTGGAWEPYNHGAITAVSGAYYGGEYSPTQNRIYFAPYRQSRETTWHYLDCNTGDIVAYAHNIPYTVQGKPTIAFSAYRGAAYSPTQNRIYFAPHGQGNQALWHYLDCNTGDIVAYATDGVFRPRAYTGCVYSPTQNRIYMIPDEQSEIPLWHYIDCDTGEVVEYNNGVPQWTMRINAFKGGVYSPTQNRIYLVPSSQANQTNWYYIDCSTGNVVAYAHGVTAVSGAYTGGVYSPTQNRIYLVPFAQANQTNWHYIDCSTGNVVAYVHGTSAVSGAYLGGVYNQPQNRIYLVPSSQANQTNWHYIDCATGNVVAYAHGVTAVASAYAGGVYSPDQNRLYPVPLAQAGGSVWHYLQFEPFDYATCNMYWQSSPFVFVYSAPQPGNVTEYLFALNGITPAMSPNDYTTLTFQHNANTGVVTSILLRKINDLICEYSLTVISPKQPTGVYNLVSSSGGFCAATTTVT